ncbi:CHAT domain-containing protein [Moorena sp. SIO1F2]|uniref:CHAT domain-containing protein n=1 Tax=Moorena sp. SIO1F2 TaxID=2607819 RepID=UPI0025F38571|nr:CHAT domain-containing protein [Moorena sp. SIO1F2]
MRKQRNDLQYQYLPIGSSFNFEQFKNNLDDHTAIVEFYITWDKLLTFIFTRETQQPIVWQSEPQDLDKFVNWKDEYLRDYKADKINKNNWQNDLSNRLDELADILSIDDIIKQIPERCDRLILIPHQVLHLLPLHALPITSKQGEGKSKIIMEQFPAGVSYAPSCQLLQLAQTRKRPDFTHLFAVQNPSADLVYTNLEVEVIKGYFNSPPDTEVLVENAATKAAIDSQVLNTFHVVHFSCHGYFNYQEPRKSALILANAQKPASAEPNSERYLRISEEEVFDLEQCLTIDEVFELQLEQCRLVTLSACETGLIDYTNISDEYVGLPSGFLVAGSPAVVSSLWKVNDLSTALLMIKFYHNLLKPMSLALALNQAQLWLRDATVQELLDWAEELTKQLNLENNFKEKIKKELRFFKSEETPFYSPFYWAAYCAIGKYYF